MKINRKSLLEAMKIASKVCEKKTNFPVLSCVLLDGERQELQATDLEIGLVYPLEITDYTHETKPEEIPEEFQIGNNLADLTGPQLKALAEDYGIELPAKAKVAEIRETILAACEKSEQEMGSLTVIKEKFCLPCDRFRKILETLEEDTVTITVAESTGMFNQNIVCVGENFSSLHTMDTSEFPVVEILEDGFNTRVEVKRKDLSDVAKVSVQETQGFNLSMVHFDRDNQAMVATDGHRLHWVELEGFTGESNIEFPAAAMKVVNAAFKREDTVPLEYNPERKVIRIPLENGVIIARSLEAKFPDWKAVLPKPENQHSITVAKAQLEKPLAQTMVLTNERYSACAVRFNGGIDVESYNPDVGGYQKTSIPVIEKTYGDDIEMKAGFNPRYLLDAMRPITSENVEIKFVDDSRPLCMDHEKFHALVMPMRV
jgi:DNA polymerase III subunit beta